MFLKIKTDLGIILVNINTIFQIHTIEDHEKHFVSNKKYLDEYKYVIVRNKLPTSNSRDIDYENYKELLITEEQWGELLNAFTMISPKKMYYNITTMGEK